MKWQIAAALLALSDLAGAAQPVGPVDAIVQTLEIKFQSVMWLRPDGTFIVLRQVVTDVFVSITSGRTGNYTLEPHPTDPNRRVLSLDGAKFTEFLFSPDGTALGFWRRTDTDPMVNTSARARAQSSDSVIAGFIISGSRPRWVLVRGIGPTLASFGVPNPLATTRLEIYRSEKLIASSVGRNPAATGNPIFDLAGAFRLPDGSADSAIFMLLDPGAYTASTSPADAAGEGSALTEIFVLPYSL